MSAETRPVPRPTPWLTTRECRLEDLAAVLDEGTRTEDYPHAARLEQQVLIYETADLGDVLGDPSGRRALQGELATALLDGPGIVVFTGAFDDRAVVDQATAAFASMIDQQHASGATAGDHFAKPGANDRVWNALEKLAVGAPEAFVGYYANDVLALVAEAWLGPAYQVTSTINVVNPGGDSQRPHRDYHLGFLSSDQAEQYPTHAHALSPALTLQCAVAHGDMPIESGPTLYLPHSQKYAAGYLAYHLTEFSEHFDRHHVQLPLRQGDAVFFNPALFHGAGANRSSGIKRMANLLQISSAFGRAMESVDRRRIAEAIYPALLAARRAGASSRSLANVVASCAEGYPFPTNLDREQPVDGLMPPTQAEILRRAVEQDLPADELGRQLGSHSSRKLSH